MDGEVPSPLARNGKSPPYGEVRWMKRRCAESIRFFSFPDMKYVKLVCGANVTNKFSRHVHSTFSIGIVDRGTRIISQGGKSTFIPENSLFIINPGAPHSCRSPNRDGHSYRIVCVDTEVAAARIANFRESQALPHFSNILLSDEELLGKARGFFSLFGGASSILERESVFFSLFSELIIRHGDESPTPWGAGPGRIAIEKVVNSSG